MLDVCNYLLGVILTRHKKRIRHPHQRNVPCVAGARRTVGLNAECSSGLPRIQKTTKNAALDMNDSASWRAFVIIAVMAVAIEPGVRARPQERGPDRPPDLIMFEG